MPVSVNIGGGGGIGPICGVATAGTSGGGVIPISGTDFPLLINSSPIASSGAAVAAGAAVAVSTAPAAGGRILITGGSGHGRASAGHNSRESSTGPIRDDTAAELS